MVEIATWDALLLYICQLIPKLLDFLFAMRLDEEIIALVDNSSKFFKISGEPVADWQNCKYIMLGNDSVIFK